MQQTSGGKRGGGRLLRVGRRHILFFSSLLTEKRNTSAPSKTDHGRSCGNAAGVLMRAPARRLQFGRLEDGLRKHLDAK